MMTKEELKLYDPNFNVLESHFYRMSKYFLIMFGQWPWMHTFFKVLMSSVVMSYLMIICYPGLRTMYFNRQDIDAMTRAFIPTTIIIFAYAKILTYTVKNREITRLLELIRDDWYNLTSHSDKQILIKQIKIFYLVTQSYSISGILGGLLFGYAPLVSKVLDLIKPLDQPRPMRSLYNTDLTIYNMDININPATTLTYGAINSLLGVTTNFIFDSVYVMLVIHAASMFDIIKLRLSLVGQSLDYRKNNFKVHDEQVHEELRFIVAFYDRTVRYCKLIDDTCTWYQLVILGNTAFILAAGAMQILVMEKAEGVRFVILISGLILHLFVYSYAGQTMLNHSQQILNDTYSAPWYKLHKSARQTINILQMRNLLPCTLTAGKLYSMSLDNFLAILQAAISYITVLSSFRE